MPRRDRPGAPDRQPTASLPLHAKRTAARPRKWSKIEVPMAFSLRYIDKKSRAMPTRHSPRVTTRARPTEAGAERARRGGGRSRPRRWRDGEERRKTGRTED